MSQMRFNSLKIEVMSYLRESLTGKITVEERDEIMIHVDQMLEGHANKLNELKNAAFAVANRI